MILLSGLHVSLLETLKLEVLGQKVVFESNPRTLVQKLEPPLLQEQASPHQSVNTRYTPVMFHVDRNLSKKTDRQTLLQCLRHLQDQLTLLRLVKKRLFPGYTV